VANSSPDRYKNPLALHEDIFNNACRPKNTQQPGYGTPDKSQCHSLPVSMPEHVPEKHCLHDDTGNDSDPDTHDTHTKHMG